MLTDFGKCGFDIAISHKLIDAVAVNAFLSTL